MGIKMKLVTFSLEHANNYFATIDGGRFFVGKRVSYHENKGLMNTQGTDLQKYIYTDFLVSVQTPPPLERVYRHDSMCYHQTPPDSAGGSERLPSLHWNQVDSVREFRMHGDHLQIN
jgi:hypothetical protein